jgi:2-polyprenyl-6-methoxyphenol hydroxylase-like FAD-dependent oxidoreductase
MFWRPKPQVLVAGAGPVGLFAALSLVRRGVPVRIIDEEWRSTTHSYALALHPRSLELLDELGLIDEVLQRARAIHAIGLYDAVGRRARISFGELERKYPFVAVLAQADLEELFMTALERAGVEVEWNSRLARISPAADHVDTTVDTLGTESVGYAIAGSETVVESSHDIPFKFVIGADGHDSLVRTQLGIRFNSQQPASDFAIFEFEAYGDTPDEMCIVLGDETTNVLWPMAGNRVRWSFQLTDHAASESSRDKDRLLMQLDDDGHSIADPGWLERLIRQRAPWFQAEIGHVHWATEVHFEHRLASAFGGPRAHLVGDASHVTGPIGVQSMNGGLGEAAELGAIVAGNMNGGASLAAVEAQFGRRAEEWRRLLGVDGPGLTPNESALPWLRQRAPRLAACIPASGEDFVDLVAQVGLEPNTM